MCRFKAINRTIIFCFSLFLVSEITATDTLSFSFNLDSSKVTLDLPDSLIGHSFNNKKLLFKFTDFSDSNKLAYLFFPESITNVSQASTNIKYLRSKGINQKHLGRTYNVYRVYPNDNKEYIISCDMFGMTPENSLMLLSQEDYKDYIEPIVGINKKKVFFGRFGGNFFNLALILFFGSLLLFVVTQFRDYLYYALYCLAIAIYYSQKNEITYSIIAEYLTPEQSVLLNNSIQAIVYLMYTLFIWKFLSILDYSKKLDKMFKAYGIFAILCFVLMIAVYDIDRNFHYAVYNGFRVVTLIITSILVIVLMKSKLLLYRLIAISGVIVIAAGMAAMIMSFNYKGGGFSPIFIYTCGMIVQLLILTTAMGIKVNFIVKERLKVRNDLIKELKRNEVLEKKQIQQLEKDIEISQLKATNNSIEKEMSSMELTVLRQQLNPHFLYNSMNSLKLYILEHKTEEAVDYIDRFSQLFRKVLNNSRKSLVKLEDELSALSIYLELEQLRFYDKFEYTFEIDDNLDTTFTRIPPMIIQPFVENAILHGIAHRNDNKGKITIRIKVNKEESHYSIEIEDNGVGRRYTKEIKLNRPKNHQSLGTQIIVERLNALEGLYGQQANVVYKDLYDQAKKSLGTLVTLHMPIDM